MSRSHPHHAHRRPAGVCWLSLSLITVSLFAIFAALPRHAQAQGIDNGIVVGPAKLYDDRALENQLQSVKSGLSANYINPQTVEANEGLPQGGGLSSSQSGGSLGYKQSVSQPSGTSSSGSQSSPANGGTFPISQDFSGNAISLKSPLAVSSEDLLQQQVGLAFEATNLQLLLDHALSDRVLFLPDGTPETRQLAVLGFQISVEPRSADEYAVAEADITIGDTSGQGSPEVAMMLPQDKTYNVAKVTNNSNAFNLGAFVAPLGANLNASSARSNAYIVYDVDTVALQRPNPDQKSVTFGWQFRPVLGEKAVAPGTRQVYVLLSLPVDDGKTYSPLISVKTYWRKYDTRAKIVQDDLVGAAASYQLPALAIHPTKDYDAGLQPKVTNVETFDAGAGKILVEATGTNFSDNSSVVVGGRVIDQTSGLLVKGGNMMSFIAPLSDLEYEDPLVVGQYGVAVPIRLDVANGGMTYKATPYADAVPISRTGAGEGISISNIEIVPVDSQNSDLRITLVSRVPDRDGHLVTPLLPSNGQLIIAVGDETFGLNDHPVGIEMHNSDIDAATAPAQANSVVLDVIVKNSTLESAQKVTARYAFCGDDYRADAGLPGKPFGDDIAISMVGQNSGSTTLAITGSLSPDMMAHFAGKDYVAQVDPHQSYLILTAVGPSSAKKGSSAPHPTSNSSQSTPFARKRGPVAPYSYNSPLVGQKTYHLALLSAPASDMASQNDIVLYEPGSVPQMVSIKDAMSGGKGKLASGNNPPGLTSNGWVLLAPISQGQNNAQPAESNPSTSAATPAQAPGSAQMGPPVLEIVSQSATGISTGAKGGGKGNTNAKTRGGQGGGPGKGSAGGKSTSP